jgi:tRNA(Ile)-lysidine synthase
MKESLQRRVARTIENYRMVRAGDRVGVGVSGGSDSVALLILLNELREELGISVLILHFDHRLRGTESEQDEKFVEALAGRLGMPFHVGGADVAVEASKNRWNIEDAARRLRYAFFESVVKSGEADRVAVGHTADDQAETVLGRLLRGTGPTGLAGIYPVAGNVVRPIICERREELRNYLRQRGEVWREDSTNADQKRQRARLRHTLIPQLEREWQPEIVRHLGELAEVCRGEERYWAETIDKYEQQNARRTTQGLTIEAQALLSGSYGAQDRIADSKLRDAGLAFSRRLIRALAERAKGSRVQLSTDHVQAVLDLAEAGTSGTEIHLPGGVKVLREFDHLNFQTTEMCPEGSGGETGPTDFTYEYVVQPERAKAQELQIQGIRKRLSLKVIDWPSTARETKEANEVLDFDTLRPPLVIRNWRPGDAYRPTGRKTSRKLKELLLEMRVPAERRTGWPVLLSGGEIVWAMGLPVAAEHAAGKTTRCALEISEGNL